MSININPFEQRLEPVQYLSKQKQDKLISGINIKTINNESILGKGNISADGNGVIDSQLSEISTNAIQNKVVTEAINQINDNIITSEEVEDYISEVEENILNSVLIKNQQTLTSSEQEQVRKNIDAQKELTLTVKDNGNIVIGNLQGQTKEFMPATPSGDPMFYAYISAGAEYLDLDGKLYTNKGITNHTPGVDIERTAPWGETVVHKAGHYYLNGLGDVTEEDMLKIYTRGVINDNEIAPLAYSGFNSIRTNLGRAGSYNTSMSTPFVTFQNTAIEIVRLLTKGQTGGNMTFTGTSLFGGSSKLRVIDTQASVIIKASNSAIFSGCKALEEVRLKELSVNIFLSDSPSISKQSVKYAISNASATSAIAIKLHPDAYARLADDAEIVAALEAQPLVSLVSA